MAVVWKVIVGFGTLVGLATGLGTVVGSFAASESLANAGVKALELAGLAYIAVSIALLVTLLFYVPPFLGGMRGAGGGDPTVSLWEKLVAVGMVVIVLVVAISGEVWSNGPVLIGVGTVGVLIYASAFVSHAGERVAPRR
jgi:hypothetical protein